MVPLPPYKGHFTHPSASGQEGPQPTQTRGVIASPSREPLFSFHSGQDPAEDPERGGKELSLVGKTGQKAHT